MTKPDNVTFEQAACVPIAALTALQGLRDKGKVQPGQRVLISGASGGVGMFPVQIAKSFGADVTGVCSTRNVDMVRSDCGFRRALPVFNSMIVVVAVGTWDSPQGFPRGVGRVESRLYGFPCFSIPRHFHGLFWPPWSFKQRLCLRRPPIPAGSTSEVGTDRRWRGSLSVVVDAGDLGRIRNA